MRSHAAFVVAMAAALVWCGVAGAASAPVDPAEVVTATCLGTPGNEWFSAGAFLPDGAILVCGVTEDPDLTLGGVKATVLGQDASPVPGPKGWSLITEWLTPTGEFAAPKLEVPGVDALAGREQPFSLEPPLTAREQKQRAREEKQRELEQRAALKAIPRAFQWVRKGESEEVESEEGELQEARSAYRRLTWMDPAATGFLAVFTPDLKTVRRLYRFPRGAGSITSVLLGKDGHVYIAGAATDRIGRLCSDVREEVIENPEGISDETFGCRRTYLAKLSADLSSVVWVCDLKGWSIAPQLTQMANGNLGLNGPGLRWYTPEGKLVGALPVGKVDLPGGMAINPLNGQNTRVGDWLNGTGREPYRTPRLYIYDRAGEAVLHLYGWRGPPVGMDCLRLVADSAVKGAVYDAEGNLYVHTWSHGGNNVMTRYPWDLDRRTPNALGLTVSNGMASTFCLVKMTPDYDVATATIVGTSGISQLGVCEDGYVATWGGGNYNSLTANALSDAGGTRLGVLSPDFSQYVFLSAVPDVGTRVTVGGDYNKGCSWGFASGKVGGRSMLLCLSGATPDEGNPAGPPLKNPVQASFGGGLMDGYAVLLKLPEAAKPVPAELKPNQKKRDPKPYDGSRTAEGKVFHFGTESYVTVKAVFRDEKDAMWPSFFVGRGVDGGTLTYGTTKAAANFALDCPTVLQEGGDQSRRVCGELVRFTTTEVANKKGTRLVADLDNKVRFTATGSSPWTLLGGGIFRGKNRRSDARCTLDGELQVGSRKVPVRGAECEASFIDGVRSGRNKPTFEQARLTIRFAVPGKDIGLGGDLAGQAIRVQIDCVAAGEKDPSQAKKVELPTLDLRPGKK